MYNPNMPKKPAVPGMQKSENRQPSVNIPRSDRAMEMASQKAAFQRSASPKIPMMQSATPNLGSSISGTPFMNPTPFSTNQRKPV